MGNFIWWTLWLYLNSVSMTMFRPTNNETSNLENDWVSLRKNANSELGSISFAKQLVVESKKALLSLTINAFIDLWLVIKGFDRKSENNHFCNCSIWSESEGVKGQHTACAQDGGQIFLRPPSVSRMSVSTCFQCLSSKLLKTLSCW